MSQHYSDPSREQDPHALPDVEVFELTAREVAERDGELIQEYLRLPEFRLAMVNSRVSDAMFDAMVEEEGIKGGWFYWYCFPGCMPDSDAIGPFDSRQEALDAAREDV